MQAFLKQYFLSRIFLERLISVIGMIIVVIIARDFAVFFLTAFLCAYLFHEAAQWTQSHLHTLAKKIPKQFTETVLWL